MLTTALVAIAFAAGVFVGYRYGSKAAAALATAKNDIASL